jgi:hypothetical protein
MYGTVAGLIAYYALRGVVIVDEAATTQALYRGSDYIRTNYVLRLAPTFTATSPEVIEASYIAASYELTTVGFWAKVYTPSQVRVISKVEGISFQPASSGNNADARSHVPRSPAIEALFVGASIANLGPLLV